MNKPETRITVMPNPVISRGVPAYSSKGRTSAANDGRYNTFWKSISPDYIAYDLSAVPQSERENIIAVWYNESTYDNIGKYVNKSFEPVDYTIEINSAEGGILPKNGWQTVVSVKNNPLSSRQHIIKMNGCCWIRMNINGTVKLNFDIHSISNGISDSWLFLGDSITGCGMNNCYGTGFATHIHNIDSRYFPIQENGGIGGISSLHGKENINRWLSMYQGRFVSIAFGTNDAWGNYTSAKKYYENTKYMIEAVLTSGKVPVLPTIPFALEKDVADHLPAYNSMVKKLWQEYPTELLHGADLESFLMENTHYLSDDGVHPSSDGYEAIRKFWAETMYKSVYNKNSEENHSKLLQKNLK